MKNKIPLNRATDWLTYAPARLVDLRTPEAFRAGFIPGSYSVPDLSCWLAARGSGLFDEREIYLLADHPEQLQWCEDFGDLGAGSELVGWFGPDALLEWDRAAISLAEIEAICPDILSIRDTLLLDIVVDFENIRHPSALRFYLNELPRSLDGLPVGTSICIAADSEEIASFAASLLWNFGFHRMSYLTGA